MRHKVRNVHFVGGGGAHARREQGPAQVFCAGWDRLRAWPAADPGAATQGWPS
jgi:hypothetical protein